MMFTIKRTQLFDDWLKTLKDAQARGAITARVQRLTQGLSGDV
nr:type II toxin-antitoxin system RelE/ParE family toxin [Vibrio anguillarum]